MSSDAANGLRIPSIAEELAAEKELEKEFADAWRLRTVIGKFSDHIAMPVEMLQEEMPSPVEEGGEKEDEENKAPEWERVNTGTALWMRNKSEVTDDEYKEFYKHVSHDFDEPLDWMHNRVEGTGGKGVRALYGLFFGFFSFRDQNIRR